jgi:hypothetical protein
MTMSRAISLVVVLLAVSCGGAPAAPGACANKAMCACGAGKYCENGGTWSRCSAIPDDPASCGHEQWPGECRDRKCVAEAGDDAGAGGTGGRMDALAPDAPMGIDVPMSGSTETGEPPPPPPDGGGQPSACTAGQSRSCAQDGMLGSCAKGTESCVNGSWGPCSVSPASADKCDVSGDDANCNGKSNEGCPCVSGNMQPCGPSVTQGICKRGTQTCNNGQWGTCEGAVYAKARDCSSSQDNDCDGKPDDTVDGTCQCAIGGSRACGTHPQDGVGRCKAGSQTCMAGPSNGSSAWGGCSGSVGPASADSCEPGDDANCNGTKNEGCNCSNGASRSCAQDGKLGNCGKGTESCTNGTWGACSVTPQANDRCDVVGDDSNCNGKKNEGCTELGQGCSSNGDCESGHCVMGICCGTACPAGSTSSCGNDGTCDATGTCRKYSNGTVCQAASCSDRSNAHEVGLCQAGVCKPGKLCDYHGCDGSNRCTTICPGATNDTGTQCEACGAEGQHCCGLNLCSSSNLGCLMSTVDGMLYCTKCGGVNERCCPGSTCRTGQCLPTHTGPPACQNCGLIGQICCANSQCSQGTCGTDAVGFPVCK